MTAIFNKVAIKVFGSANERLLKRLWPVVHEINALEPKMQRLSDDELRDYTPRFRGWIEKRVAGAEITAETPEEEKKALRLVVDEALDEILPEAFAIVREASRRATGMRHFDVQLIGGMVLHRGMIAEMKTGEGKTLVATLPAYLNAVAGRGVHVVTVNDYLAKRDTEWMGKIYSFLGLTVGCIQHDMDDSERQEAYRADITYGTNNEFGFDYLRDNMKFDPMAMVQRGHWYAIVDEVDSILIDEARTPLIISGASEDSTEKYYLANECIDKLKTEQQKLVAEIKQADGDVNLKEDARLLYHVDEKQHGATLTEEGVEEAERYTGVGNLYDPVNMDLLHCVEQSLKAHTLYHLDKQYIVKDGEVIIVDEFTGRMMPGRRWSDGLHQAVEAKENVKIERENQTLATISFQNYFRMYNKLAGMTGTAETEAAEFSKIYNLDIVVIPTNRPMRRVENADVVFRTEKEKFYAVSDEIQKMNETGQPVLVGTTSIEKSERLSDLLKKKAVRHVVLNAKYHDREAEVAAGGLHILGTERHESRRVDNQLRGRAGRQGDPGSSRFYLSLEDDLMRIFAKEWVSNLLQRLGMEEGVPIESRLISRRIEAAQKAVEAQNFEARKHLLEYDDVMNKQREAVYGLRRQLLEGVDQKDLILEDYVASILGDLMTEYAPSQALPDDWNITGLKNQIFTQFGVDILAEGVKPESLNRQELGD